MNDFLTIKNDRRLCGLLMLLMAVLGVVFYSNIYLPQRAEILSRQQTFETRRAELLMLERFTKAHPDTEKFGQEIQKRLDDSRERMPEIMDFSEFIDTFQQLAKSNGIKIKGIVPTPAVQQGKYASLDFQAEVNGEYQQLLGLLFDIEQQKRFTRITGMKIKESAEGTQNILLNVRIYALSAE